MPLLLKAVKHQDAISSPIYSSLKGGTRTNLGLARFQPR